MIDMTLGFPIGEAQAYLDMGTYYAEKKEYQKSIENLSRAEKTNREINYALGQLSVLIELSWSYIGLPDLKTAEEMASKSLTLANELNYKEQKLRALAGN